MIAVPSADRNLLRPEAVLPDVALRWTKAFSHPIRVEILRFLSERGTATACNFADAQRLAVGTARYHFRRLQDLHLIRVASRIRRRGVFEQVYALQDERETRDAMRFARGEGLGRAESVDTRRVILDAAAIAQLRVSVAALVEEMRRLEAETARRGAADARADSFDVSVSFAVEEIRPWAA
jgi:DNA-binding transcriptional ArsR family regulator